MYNRTCLTQKPIITRIALVVSEINNDKTGEMAGIRADKEANPPANAAAISRFSDVWTFTTARTDSRIRKVINVFSNTSVSA